MTVSPVHVPAFRTRLALFAGDIKLHHTIFALPWALLAAVLAGRTFPQTPLTAGKLLLVLAAMVTARTVAMSANRLLDRKLDARNPRTANRPLPAGKLSPGFVAVWAALCCLGFVVATAGFQIFYHNPWPLLLAGPVLAYLWGYPLLKRFTGLCHYYLGVALALAPVCAWVAVAGRIDWPPIVMFAAVATWTAGFDIIYACQDYDSDIACGVFSIPAKLGIAGALWVSRATHLLCAAMLLLLGWIVPQFGAIYFVGAALAIALLCVEQGLVRANDLSKVNVAFFTVNGMISVLVGTLGILDICWR
jgi:4-hydroxybenzoate polyprenyltransferase